MFELIIKDIMEVAGYLPIGILCGCIAVVVYLVYTVSPAGKKVSAGGRVRKSIVWFLLVVYLVVMAVTAVPEAGQMMSPALVLTKDRAERRQAEAGVW